MNKRRILCALLCLVMLLGLVPGGVLAKDSTSLTIGGQTYDTLTEDITGEGWSWNAETKVLTLKGYAGSRIHANNDLKIELAEGTSNTVTEKESPSGIEARGLLEIGGSGNLRVVQRGTTSLYGILARGGVIIGGSGNVMLDVKATGINTAVGVQSTNADLIIRDSVNLTVYVMAEAQAIDDNPTAYGMYTYATVVVTTSGTLDVITTATGEISDATGIRAEVGVAVEGDGNVNVSASADGSSSDAYGISSGGNVKVDGTASLSTVAEGNANGYGVIFETNNIENPDAVEAVEKATVELGEEVRHADIEGTTTAIQTNDPEKSKLSDSNPDTFDVTGGSTESRVVIEKIPVVLYTVRFDANGGSVGLESTKTQENGRLADLPVAEGAEGDTFLGWFNVPEGGRQITTNTQITADMTIFAHWSKPAPVNVEKPVLNLKAYLFDGQNYMVANTPYRYDLPDETGEFTLYAYVPQAAAGVQVHYIVGAKAEQVMPLSGEAAGYHSFNLKVEPKEDFSTTSVRVWLSLEDSDSYSDSFSNVLTLYVKKPTPPEYRLRFQTNGGSSIPSVAAQEGVALSLGAYAPTRDGFDFVGWYSDEALTTPVAAVVMTKDSTVYAMWLEHGIQRFTVEFETEGGSVLPKITAAENTQLALTAYVPERTGFTFTGWYTDNKLSNKLDTLTLTEDTTVYAGWEKIIVITHTLSFEIGGSQSQPDLEIVEGETADLTKSNQPAAREGYTFLGWFADKTLKHRLESIRMTQDVTVYGGWEKSVEVLPFADVSDTVWYHPGVSFCYRRELMNGTSTTKFSPDTPTNRAMIVTILHRMELTPAPTLANPFIDIPAKQWYTDAVVWAAQENLVNGYGAGRFGPLDDISREQLAAILYRYAKYRGEDVSAAADLSGFPDAAKLSGWAKEAMQWAVAKNLISGVKTGGVTLLQPQGKATRAMVATILMRFSAPEA